MGDREMLQWFYEQSDASYKALCQAEDERGEWEEYLVKKHEELKERLREKPEEMQEYYEKYVCEAAAIRIKIREYNNNIEQIEDVIKRINENESAFGK